MGYQKKGQANGQPIRRRQFPDCKNTIGLFAFFMVILFGNISCNKAATFYPNNKKGSDINALLRKLEKTPAIDSDIYITLIEHREYAAIFKPIILKRIKEDSLVSREQWILLLGALGIKDQDALEVIFECIRKEDTRIKLAAITALRKIQPLPCPSDITDSLTELSRSPSEELKLEAVQCLGAMGDRARSSITALEAEVEVVSGIQQAHICMALIRIDPKNTIARSRICKLIKTPDHYVQTYTILSIASFGSSSSEFLPILTDLVDVSDPKLKALTIYAIEEIGFPGASGLGPIERALKDPCPDVVIHAAQALGVFHCQANTTIPLISALQNNNDESVQISIIQALAQFGGEANNAVKTLTHLLEESPSLQVRFYSAQSLGEIGPGAAEALSVLNITSQRSDKVGAAASSAIRRIQNNGYSSQK